MTWRDEHIYIRICTDDGWHRSVLQVPDGSIDECYALPSSADRIAFWEEKAGTTLPRGPSMIWEPWKEAA
jgi:hypothetical protein